MNSISKTKLRNMVPTAIQYGSESISNNTMKQLNFSGFCSEEFPQRKALDIGIENLTTIELISLIIGAGTEKSVEQARQIYAVMNERVSEIAKSRVEDLQEVQGIGNAKAVAIKAAIELGKRCYVDKTDERPILDYSRKIYDYLHPLMSFLNVEEAHLLLLNNRLALIKHIQLSRGGLTETAIDVRIIMKEAILHNATALVVAHNHPSGSLKPSSQDDALTKQVKDACRTMRIHFVDHLIVTDRGYYSYNDEGKI